MAVAQVCAWELGEGRDYCPQSTMYRILAEAGQASKPSTRPLSPRAPPLQTPCHERSASAVGTAAGQEGVDQLRAHLGVLVHEQMR